MPKLDVELIHQDKRGSLHSLKLKGKEILIVFSAKGAPRGGHYHRKNQQHIVLEGSFLYREIDARNPKKEIQKKLKAGDVVEVKAYRAHLFTALEESIMIEFKKDKRKAIIYEPYRKSVNEYLNVK